MRPLVADGPEVGRVEREVAQPGAVGADGPTQPPNRPAQESGAAGRPATAMAAARWLAGLARATGALARRARPGPTARTALLALAELALVAGLALLPALFFWRILTDQPGDVATFPRGDFTDLHYPYRRFIADELARGRLPVWNPYVSAGHPALGDPQFASLYPIGALFALRGGAGLPVLVLEQQVIAHFALAGVFTYLLGRRLLRTRTGALVAALVFTYGGYLTSFPVQQMIILQTSVWLPLILLLLDLALARRSPALAVPAGLALTLAALAGHPQTLFYVLLGAGLYFAYRAWSLGLHVTQLLIGAVFLGLGLGLAAPQLIPAYQHLQLTTRGDATYAFTSTGFLFRELFGLVIPYRFGGQALYNGILPLVLVGVALLQPRGWRARGFWLGLAVLALLLSFGGGTFLQSLAYVVLPPLKFRDHERLAFLVGLAVALLAGAGADALLGRGGDRALLRDLLRPYVRRLAQALVFILGVAVLVLYGAAVGIPEAQGIMHTLADRTFFTALLLALSIGVLLLSRREPRAGRTLSLAIVLLVGLDLFSTNWTQNLVPGSPEKLYPVNAAVGYLRSHAFGLYRVASEGLLAGDGNAGSVYRLQDVVGNSPLELDGYVRFGKEVNEWTRLRLLNVRFVITRRSFDQDGRFRLVAREGEISTYEIRASERLPRAWVVHRTLFAGSEADALALVNGIDPAAEAVVEDEQVWLDGHAGAGASAEPSWVEVTEYEPDRLALAVRLSRPGLLVVSEVYHPDWVATVGGQEARILRVDGVLRGLALPAGEHRVEMTFRSRGLSRGLEVARWAALLAAGVVVVEAVARLTLRPRLVRR